MAVRMNMQGKHVLSMGTDDPWLEALILEAGAEKITSLGKTMFMHHCHLITGSPRYSRI